MEDNNNNKILLDIDIKNQYDYILYQTNLSYRRINKIEKNNSFSLINTLKISNYDSNDYEDLTLKVTSNSPFIKFNDSFISFVNSNQVVYIDNIEPIINYDELYNLNEPIDVILNFELLNNNQKILISKTVNFQLSPFIQSSFPYKFNELYSCFVTPNDFNIDALIPSFIEELSKINGEKRFLGYQNNDIKNIISEMMAIFNGLYQFKIAYSNPPASFEYFQKVRIPSSVLKTHGGTCLDLAILYCACLENVGLHPILIITNNHAYAGCFLNEDDNFINKVEDDYSKIYNLASKGINKICLVECTGFTLENYADFNVSIEDAYNKTKDAVNYFKAIDISSCHKSIYKPIPTFNEEGVIKFNIKLEGQNEKLESDNFDSTDLSIDQNIKEDKFKYWERKLLDLSGSNKLINLKFKDSLAQLAISSAQYFYDCILKNNNYKFMLNEKFEKSKETLYFNFSNEDNERIINDNLNKGIINLYSKELVYKKIIKKALSSVEETGSNPLYLTIGLIRYNLENSKRIYYCPIILVPARPKIKKSNGYYEIEFDPDNAFLNISFFEFLKLNTNINSNELYGVIEDKKIKDLKTLFNLIRMKTSKECQIIIEENACFLSNFSFNNYIIWDDIKNKKSQLLENEIIKAFVDGTSLNNKKSDVESLNDEDTIPEEVAAPLSADSSQLKAVIKANEGESFILDGPPGTGKSQTIVNMIVNALYHNKTVLFVAEKMAALDVVYKRLKDIGLDIFALELHSNKSNKRSFLNQLDRALKFSQSASPEEFKEVADDLLTKRKSLNELINKMHEKKYFTSLYDAILNYEALKEFDNVIEVNTDFAKNLTSKIDQEIEDELNKLVILYRDKGPFINNPFYPFKMTSFNNQDLDTLKEYLSSLLLILTKINTQYDEVIKMLDINIKFDRNDIETLNKLVDLINNKTITLNINYSDQAIKFDEMNKLIFKTIDENNEIKDSYLNHFKDELKSFNSDEFFNIYNSSNDKEKKKLIKKKYKELKKEIEDKKTFKFKKRDTYSLILAHNKFFKNTTYLNENSSIITNFLIIPLSVIEKDTNQYLSIYNDSITFYNYLNSLKINSNLKFELYNKLSKFYKDKDEMFIYKNSEFSKSLIELKIIEEQLLTKFKFDKKLIQHDSNYFYSYLNLIKDEINSLDYVDDIVLYNDILNKISKLNFSIDFIDKYRQGILLENDLVKYYKVSLYKRIIKLYFEDTYFSTFNGLLFNNAIDKYKEEINKYSLLTIEETASRISSRFPKDNVDYAQSTSVYQLNRYIKNGGYRTSIRHMLNDLEELIRTLCPCFLMSPLSAAQYLSVNSKKFDIVIFDEASQIPTYEAIGAIARGNSLIVAGDPQQLPPTNFFKVNMDNIDDEDDNDATYQFEDLESLLDDCIALNINDNRLLWHYRSKHESLINFSNNYFYNNSLYTFPSPTNNLSNVKFKYIKFGVNNKGINKEVAREIVNEVARRFKDPILRHKTIGIVTFNIKQQEYISNLINDLFEQNPQYQEINDNNPDPLFVKNLENVQGDERDVILFSVGFSKNNNGKLNMFFGPLSLDKGERRLNVAVTRAKEEMIVFSSIKSIDIDTSKAKNNGALTLKNFLNYAEHGNTVLISTNSNQVKHQLGIEKAIQKDLLEKGYRSDIAIGESKFKIDLAIKDNNDNYILGVVCDSESYNNAKTCRDRNVIQVTMCNKLNWKIYRIWTLEYYKNPKKVINDLINVIQNVNNLNFDNDSLNIDKTNIKFKKKANEFIDNGRPYYKHELISTNTYNEFYFNKIYYFNDLVNYFDKLIEVEGPISLDLIKDRFKNYLSIKKWGTNVDNLFNINFIPSRYKVTKTLEKSFYWPISNENCEIDYYRRSNYQERSLDNIPIEEYFAIMSEILLMQTDISKNDLIRLIANKFNYTKISDVSFNFLEKIINEIVNKYPNKFQSYSNEVDNTDHIKILS